MACTISDDWSYLGFKTVILENELIRATVLPDLGAKIHELIYKPSDHDFMYHHPRVECRVPVFDVNVDDWWTGGMDEAIPGRKLSISWGSMVARLVLSNPKNIR